MTRLPKRLYLVVILVASLAACGPSTITMYATPDSPHVGVASAYPTVVDWKLLTTAEARKCGDPDRLPAPHEPGPGMAHPTLYQGARYAAIDAVKGADGLTGERVLVEHEPNQQCVTVKARAFQLQRMHSPQGKLDGSLKTDLRLSVSAPQSGPHLGLVTGSGPAQSYDDAFHRVYLSGDVANDRLLLSFAHGARIWQVEYGFELHTVSTSPGAFIGVLPGYPIELMNGELIVRPRARITVGYMLGAVALNVNATIGADVRWKGLVARVDVAGVWATDFVQQFGYSALLGVGYAF